MWHFGPFSWKGLPDHLFGSEKVRTTTYFDHGNWAECVEQWHKKDPKQRTNTCLYLLQLLRAGVPWYARSAARRWLTAAGSVQAVVVAPAWLMWSPWPKAVWVCWGCVFPLTISPGWESRDAVGPVYQRCLGSSVDFSWNLNALLLSKWSFLWWSSCFSGVGVSHWVWKK